MHDLAGFHVYREERRERVRVSQALLQGGPAYEFVDHEAPAGPVEYWLAEVGRAGGITWHGPRGIPPVGTTATVLSLAPNVPNPFSAGTSITFTLPADGRVTLVVYDVQGRRVATLVDRRVEAGEHTIPWDGRAADGTPAAAGFYIIRLAAGDEVRIRKAILTR